MNGSVLHLHGLTTTNVSRLGSSHAHRIIRFGPISAVVSRCPGDGHIASEQAAADRIMVHHDLLTLYSHLAPVLPMRFGTFFSSLHAMRRTLRQNEQAHVAALANLGTRQEYGLRVLAASSPPVSTTTTHPPDSGIAFLSQRRVARNRRAVTAELRQALCQEILRKLTSFAPVNIHTAKADLLNVSILLAPDGSKREATHGR